MIQQLIKYLAVVDRRIRDRIALHQLGRMVRIDVVLVAVVIRVVLLCPTRIGVFLRQLVRVAAPIKRNGIFLDEYVFFSLVSLPGITFYNTNRLTISENFAGQFIEMPFTYWATPSRRK